MLCYRNIPPHYERRTTKVVSGDEHHAEEDFIDAASPLVPNSNHGNSSHPPSYDELYNQNRNRRLVNYEHIKYKQLDYIIILCFSVSLLISHIM